MRSRVLGFLALAFALVGLGGSIASLIDTLSPTPTFCTQSSCETVRSSAWARPLGIPLPFLGIAYFLAMSVLAFVPRKRLRLVLAVLGGLGGIGLLLVQAFSIGAWCMMCLVVDPAAIVQALAVLAGAGTIRATWPNIAATVPTAGLVVLALGLWMESPIAAASAGPVPEVIAKEQTPGTVTIVEFIDFECPYCRELDRKLTIALARTKRPVRIVRKMVPLPSHVYAIPAAMAWSAADMQGKGDEMAKALFAMKPDEMTPAGCEAAAVRLGCDVVKYRQDFASAELRARIERDIADAQAANLEGFPTIYIGTQKFEGSDHEPEVLLAAIERAAR